MSSVLINMNGHPGHALEACVVWHLAVNEIPDGIIAQSGIAGRSGYVFHGLYDMRVSPDYHIRSGIDHLTRKVLLVCTGLE